MEKICYMPDPVEVGMDWMGYAMLKSKKVPEPRSIRLKVIYAQFNSEVCLGLSHRVIKFFY